MKVSEFDYNLPKESIAIVPPKVRGESKLLHLNKTTGHISHLKYSDIVNLLNPGDLLILNNSKVVKARILTKDKKEIFLLEKHKNDEKNIFFILNNKTLKGQKKINIENIEIEIIENLNNGILKVFSAENLYQLAARIGKTPIPPYLNRESTKDDEERYQTIFAKEEGSVAAPTASLNFTREIEQALINKGVRIKYITLHVGYGTFKPIGVEDFENHKMHNEYFFIPKDTIKSIRETKRIGHKIVGLGTTTTRALEASYDKIVNSDTISDVEGEANIFIYPGYKFKVVDKLITNFHAPRSTVLMLTAAIAGKEKLLDAYNEAIKNKYKFLSFGDSMFIE